MVRSLTEIHAEQKALAEEEKKAVKAHKKEAVATVKKLILEFNLTKGDIRGKAMKQLEGWNNVWYWNNIKFFSWS